MGLPRPQSPLRPPILEELAELLGAAAAEKLLRDFGGRDLHVPMAPGENHPITASIGVLAAARLADVYRGEKLEFPLPRDKARRILALRAEGKSPREIQKIVRCTQRWVFKVLARDKALRSAEPDLFT